MGLAIYVGQGGNHKSLAQYQPKQAKLSDIIKAAGRKGPLTDSHKKTIAETLKEAGVTSGTIKNVVQKNRATSVSELKRIASHLYEWGVISRSGDALVKGYVRQEAIKRRNLDLIKHERFLESMNENVAPEKSSSFSQRPTLRF